MSAIKNKRSSLFSYISSVQFAIIILSLIAAASVSGTLIRQQAGIDEYLSIYSETTYRVLSALSLDDVFHAPWFYLLIILFTINLITCTISRLKRFLKNENKSHFPEASALFMLKPHLVIEGQPIDTIMKTLDRGYRTVTSTENTVVLEKGRISRFSVFIIHGSIIIILIGSLAGLIFGIKGSIILRKGETKDTIILRGNNQTELPLGFSILCNDFQVTHYDSGEPKDFMSSVTITDGNKTIEGTIRVNHPLEYRGFRFYQATYGSSPKLLFTIGNQKVTLKEKEVFRKSGATIMVVRYYDSIHAFGPGVLLTYADKDGETKTQWFLRDIEEMREHILGTTTVRLDNITTDPYTGLQVSKDPGVYVVWAGFASILFGLYINFFVFFRRIIIHKEAERIIVAGIAPRNKTGLEEEFQRLQGRLHGNQP